MGPVPANCNEIGTWFIRLDLRANIIGSLSIPGVVNATDVYFEGTEGHHIDWNPSNNKTKDYPLNLTSVDLPDLVNVVYGDFSIQLANKIESLSVPRLIYIQSSLVLNLTGENAPAINLSFPSLYTVGSIRIIGNIDS